MQRDVFQPLYTYLDPISQLRIRQCSKSLYNWSKHWPKKLWNITELLEEKNRKNYEFAETELVICEKIFVKIVFKKRYLTCIDIWYRPSKQHPCYVNWNILGQGKCILNNIPREYRNTLYGRIFVIYRNILVRWFASVKYTKKLLNCCRHMVPTSYLRFRNILVRNSYTRCVSCMFKELTRKINTLSDEELCNILEMNSTLKTYVKRHLWKIRGDRLKRILEVKSNGSV